MSEYRMLVCSRCKFEARADTETAAAWRSLRIVDCLTPLQAEVRRTKDPGNPLACLADLDREEQRRALCDRCWREVAAVLVGVQVRLSVDTRPRIEDVQRRVVDFGHAITESTREHLRARKIRRWRALAEALTYATCGAVGYRLAQHFLGGVP